MTEQQGGPWQDPSGRGGAGVGVPGSGTGPYAPAYPGQTQQPPGYNPGAYGAPAYPPGPAGPPPWGQPAYGSGGPAPRRSDYAHWGRRVGAFLIDQIPTYVGLIVFYIGYGFSIAAMIRNGSTTFDYRAGLVPMVIGWVIMLGGLGWTIYNRWIIGGRTGQSLGKRVLKIRLVGEPTGAPLGPVNAFLRDLVHVVDGAAFYIGYLWPLWDDRRQTFADKIMTSIVVDAPRDGVAPPHG